MNRRGFLKFLSVTPAAPIAAKAAASIPAVPAAVVPEVAAAPVAAAMAGAASSIWCWSVSVADIDPVRWSTSLTDFEGQAKK